MTLDQILLAAILAVLVLRWFSETALYKRLAVNAPNRVKRWKREKWPT